MIYSEYLTGMIYSEYLTGMIYRHPPLPVRCVIHTCSGYLTGRKMRQPSDPSLQ
jgi:hypothetical protein